jgi:hypothetical protein
MAGLTLYQELSARDVVDFGGGLLHIELDINLPHQAGYLALWHALDYEGF